MGRFRILDHTADYAVEIKAKTAPGLIRNAIFAMFSGLLESFAFSNDAPLERLELPCSEPFDEFLYDTLRELLFIFYTRRLIPASISLRKHRLAVVMTRWDPSRMKPDQEIKAVTRHRFSIQKKQGFLVATIIFDV